MTDERQLSEQDTSGKYAYLSRWLERNRGNERLLGLGDGLRGHLTQTNCSGGQQ